MRVALHHVRPLPHPELLSEGPYGRTGTVFAPRSRLEDVLGAPDVTPIDDKVKVRWMIDTPRGAVCVRDYWWNQATEWSVVGNRLATLWALAFFRAHAIPGFRGAFRGYAERAKSHG